MINELYTHAYCKDDISKIENYDKAMADTAQTWALHHRLELTLDGEFAHTAEELKRLDMYYNRPYFEHNYHYNDMPTVGPFHGCSQEEIDENNRKWKEYLDMHKEYK